MTAPAASGLPRRSRLLIGLLLLAFGGMAAWVGGCASARLEAGAPLPSEPTMKAFLESTTAIDCDAAPIRELAARLSAGRSSDRERAVAIHDYVRDAVRFGFQTAFYEVKASEVLAAGIGYCNTKSTLFIALLRAAGIPARQHFVDLDAALLHGIIDPGTPYVDHSFTEVFLDGSWLRTDSYILDRPFFEAARRRLMTEKKTIGYGAHVNGTTTWDGRNDAFSQFVDDATSPSFTTRDHGVHRDVLTFYRDAESPWNGLGPFTRVLLRIGLPRANRTAECLRRSSH